MGKISKTDYHPKLNDITFNFEIETITKKTGWVIFEISHTGIFCLSEYRKVLSKFAFAKSALDNTHINRISFWRHHWIDLAFLFRSFFEPSLET